MSCKKHCNSTCTPPRWLAAGLPMLLLALLAAVGFTVWRQQRQPVPWRAFRRWKMRKGWVIRTVKDRCRRRRELCCRGRQTG